MAFKDSYDEVRGLGFHHHNVGICKFWDGFRIARDANRVFWWPDRHNGTNPSQGAWVELDIPNPIQLKKAFGKSKIYETHEEACADLEEIIKEQAKYLDNIYVKEIITTISIR